MSADDLKAGCKEVIFIFARGSTEPGNMGIIIGPETCSALKRKLPGKVACQGVGGAYKASMMDNGKAQFTDPAAIQEALKIFNEAAQKCPKAKITFGGYSQGGAVMHGAVSELSEAVKKQVVAGALFGDSMNGKHSGVIPKYPKENIIEVCNDGDGICSKRIQGITAAHLAYGGDGSAEKAATFLAGKLKGV